MGAISGLAFLMRPIGIVVPFAYMICWVIQSSGKIKRPEVMPFPDFHEETEIERDRILRQRSMAFLLANPTVH